MDDGAHSRWERLLVSFFGLGNEIERSNPVVEKLLRANEPGLERNPLGPFFLPQVARGVTTYFAIATEADQARELQVVLNAAIGPTYTTIQERATPLRSDFDQLVEAAIRFAGSPAWIFTFDVVGPAKARRYVREQVHTVLGLLLARPHREVDPVRPIGRLLRDFDRALEVRDLSLAEQLLLGPIAETGRLSGLNRLFLHVRLLVAAERWEELEQLPSLNDLLRTSRPAMVSDALAQLAIRLVDRDPSGGENQVAHFQSVAGDRFGALISGVDRIRSAAGARYYVLWQLAAGDDASAIRDRLEGLAWLEDPTVASALNDVAAAAAPAVAVSPEMIAEFQTAGRLDAAVALISRSQTNIELLPALLGLIAQTYSSDGMRTLDRYREDLGAAVVDDVIAQVRTRAGVSTLESTGEVDELAPTWPRRIASVLDGVLTSEQLVLAADEGSLLELVRSTQTLDELAEAVEAAAGAPRASQVVDGALGILRHLGNQIPDGRRSRLVPLRRAVLELWCLGDESGDFTRASDLLDVLEDLLSDGCGPAEFDEFVELLGARWAPFLTDRAFPIGVRAVEILVAAQPDDVHVLNAFASRLFGRVTAANVDRLPAADLAVADALCVELELGFTPSARRSTGVVPESNDSGWKGLVGIYTLDENASRRARTALASLVPGAEVRAAHDKVASDRLRELAAAAAVMVVAAGVAKHAATDAIRAARGPRIPNYAAGKGSSSLVRAALTGIAELTTVTADLAG